MRFELMEGGDWRGEYSTRRAAMADAEMFAAKRGQTVRWGSDSSRGVTIGVRDPAADSVPFTIRHAGGVRWSRAVRPGLTRGPDGDEVCAP